MPREYSITVRPNRCLNKRYRFIECHACADVCPHSAVCLADCAPEIDENLCTSCGACTTACSAGALERENYCEENLLHAAAGSESKRIVLFCRNHPSPVRRAARDELFCLQTGSCLAEVSEAALFRIALKNPLELVLDACPNCPDAPNREQVLAHVRRANELLVSVGAENTVSVTQEMDETKHGSRHRARSAGQPEFTRRETLLRFLDGGKQMLLGAIPAHQTPSPAAQREEPCRAVWKDRLVPAYRQAYESSDRHGESAVWPTVRMRPGCTNCGLCASFCAAGALRIEQRDEEAVHLFQPMLCVGCRICEHVCPTQTVVYREERMDRPFVTRILYSAETVRCKRCGSLCYPGSSGLCYFCASRPSAEDMKQAARRRMNNTGSGKTP